LALCGKAAFGSWLLVIGFCLDDASEVSGVKTPGFLGLGMQARECLLHPVIDEGLCKG
jgi:hypothetical protein